MTVFGEFVGGPLDGRIIELAEALPTIHCRSCNLSRPRDGSDIPGGVTICETKIYPRPVDISLPVLRDRAGSGLVAGIGPRS